MKIVIIGANDSVNKIIDILQNSYKNITFIPVIHDETENIEEIFAEIPSDIDGIFATGIGVYNKLCEFGFNSSISYASHGPMGLLKSFFDASKQNVILDGKNLSFDILDNNDLIDVLDEFNISINKYYLPKYEANQSETFYLENHLKLYHENKIDYIFTSFGYIYSLFKNLNLPVYRIYPSKIDVKSSFNSLLNDIGMKKLEKKSLLVYKFNLLNKENLNHTKSILYKYSNSIEGVLTEYNSDSFLIISNKNFDKNIDPKFNIRNFLEYNNLSNILVGLGTGSTLAKAINNANIAIESSNEKSWIHYYDGLAIKEYESIIGDCEQLLLSSERINEIAQDTGIKTKYIELINLSISNLDRNVFTSSELSDILGITVRSVNRILNSLIENNYAYELKNTTVNEGTGRPKRQIKIDFTNKFD